MHPDIVNLTGGHVLIPVCPEQLGGLPTPRAPAEIQGGDGYLVLAGKARVINAAGADVTAHFLRGAGQIGKLAKIYRAKGAILKERSPSCGTSEIYNGSFQHELMGGCGVTTAFLISRGLTVISEQNDIGNYLCRGRRC